MTTMNNEDTAGPVDQLVRPLVERLRGGVYGLARIELCSEAADEIERLGDLLGGMDKVTDNMVNRFLCWKLPHDFAPDCGISFDGRKDDEWNKNKTWPVGTNLLTAIQARAMLEHVLAEPVVQPHIKTAAEKEQPK